jgi:hypothetical protein
VPSQPCSSSPPTTSAATLFFSAYDERGNAIQVSGFPSGFTPIASEHFVMSPQGTQATLNYSGVSVTWDANDAVRKNTEDGTRVTRSRGSERGQELSATVKGTVGANYLQPGGAPPPWGLRLSVPDPTQDRDPDAGEVEALRPGPPLTTSAWRGFAGTAIA